MSALSLRKVDSTTAHLSRSLGLGVSLHFNVQGEHGTVSLIPLIADPVAEPRLHWFNSASGPFGLSDAEAMLSLLGELPVTLAGDFQPWYWQVLNQRMSPAVAELFCPLAPLSDITALPVAVMTCRIQVQGEDQSLHGLFRADAATLLRLLQSAPWRAHRQTLDEAWLITQPLELGHLSLTLAQLASLQPGDVLLPSLCHFDSDGNGRLQLGGRQWAVQTDSHQGRLSVQLSHEEPLEHGQ
ncbi:type III secretion system protein [Pseudomonas sp. S2_H01]